MRFALQLALGAAIAATYGCATKRDHYDVPPVPIPAQFKQAAAVRAELEPKSPSAGVAPVAARPEPLVGALLAEWWRVLSNPELDALIDRVLANNADLRIATLRIVQAKARANQAVDDQWPTVTAPFQAKGEGPRSGIGSVAPGGEIDSLHTYQISLRADWRVDLWGERSALAESSRMQLLRSTYQRDDTRRQLVATAAALYVEYLSLNDRIRVARETEVVLRGLLDGVSRRLEVGDATATELEQQRTAVYAVQATIPALELQRETVTNALAQLMGVTPVSLALSDRGLDALTFPGVLPGVPAGLVLRRPDVRVAEARLLSADADIDVARARLLPPLDLTAQVGYGSYVLSQLFQSHTFFWQAVANISATIFDHGKRSAEVNFSKAYHEELVETYVKVIYNGVRETEDAIATVQMTGKRIEAQKAATDAARRAWDLSMESYRAGAVDHLTLIDTERTYHRTLDELHRIRMERMKGVVTLFGALGGGVPQADAKTPDTQQARGTTAGGDAANAETAARPYSQYMPNDSDDGKEYWLVEIAGLHDRHGIPHAWRDLNRRFGDLMRDRSLLPRMQGRVALNYKERASWYRLYVARFDASEDAQFFCGRLLNGLQRCRVVSSLDEDFIDTHRHEVEELRDSPELAMAERAAAPVMSEGAAAPVKADRSAAHLVSEWDTVRVAAKEAAAPGVPVDILSDLIVPLTLQPVAANAKGAAVSIEARPRAKLTFDDYFLPALVVPAAAAPSGGAKP